MSNTLSKRAHSLIARTTPEQTCLRALLIFAAQNPGFDFGNYGSFSGYRSDARPVSKQLRDIKALSWRFPVLTNELLREASKRAFSGRLEFVDREGGWVGVDYCTGQYWPTEYRKAALAVISHALWMLDQREQIAV